MVKRGVQLSDPPPAEDLHRLRIDAKKLRYLLEFFGGLWPKKATSRLVKELKQFQDILGGSNDMAVQQRHLAAFAETLMAEGSTRAGTVFAMGRLADTMAERQETYAEAFAERFELFAGDGEPRALSHDVWWRLTDAHAGRLDDQGRRRQDRSGGQPRPRRCDVGNPHPPVGPRSPGRHQLLPARATASPGRRGNTPRSIGGPSAVRPGERVRQFVSPAG